MAYLYELKDIFAELQAMELDDDTFQDTLDSIDFQSDLENNIEYFVKLYRNSLADAESFKKEKKFFEAKQKESEAKAEKFKETIKNAMQLSQKDTVDAGEFKVSFRKSKQVRIVDETKIPLEYMIEKHEYKPDKNELKKLLKLGVDVAGVELVENRNLQVR